LILRRVALFAVVGIPAITFFGVTLTGPNWKSRMYAQETAALRNLQIINAAQVRYCSQYGRYARSLAELGPPISNLIPPDLLGQRQVYKFALTPTPQGSSVLALPTPLAIVSRAFYTDQSLVIRGSFGPEPATANSKVVGSAAAKPRETM